MIPIDPRGGRAYSLAVANALWPGHEIVAGYVRGGPHAWLFVPIPQRPRLVVPSERRSAAAVLRSSASGRSPSVRWAMRSASSWLDQGSGFLGGPGLELRPTPAARREKAADAMLSHLLGESVRVAWSVGPARANRKPVLQVMGTQAATLAYAKAGIDQLTTSLVGKEAAALEVIKRHRFRAVEHPDALGLLTGEGTAMLVLSPMDTEGSAPGDTVDEESAGARLTLHAMRELSTVQGQYETNLSRSPWHDRLVARIARIPTRERPARLDRLAQSIAQADTRIPFGSWHGDWHTGNYVVSENKVKVWDWERFEGDVPLGFDAQHLALQSALHGPSVDFKQAASTVVSSARRRLQPWGLPPRHAELVAALHLVDIAVRYLEDRQLNAGSDVGAVDDWALPEAEAVLQNTHRKH